MKPIWTWTEADTFYMGARRELYIRLMLYVEERFGLTRAWGDDGIYDGSAASPRVYDLEQIPRDNQPRRSKSAA